MVRNIIVRCDTLLPRLTVCRTLGFRLNKITGLWDTPVSHQSCNSQRVKSHTDKYQIIKIEVYIKKIFKAFNNL